MTEGLEIMGVDKKNIQNIKEITKIAVKGGLMEALKAGVDIIAKKYLDNNIVGDFVYDFFNTVKNAPLNNTFSEKINKVLDIGLKEKKEFYEVLEEFKGAYEKFDIAKINELAKKINSKLKVTNYDRDCISENKIIQNIAMLVNSRKEKLSEAQLQLCNVL